MEEDLAEGAEMGNKPAVTAGNAPGSETAARYGAFTQPARVGLHAGAQGCAYISR